MKYLGSTKNNITKNRNGENVPNSQIAEAVLIHCNIANNYYQQDSRVLYIFVPQKSFAQLLDILSKKLFAQNFHTFKYGLLIKIVNQ